MSAKNLTGINAKEYDRIANRISLPHTEGTVQRQINDAYYNIERELEKEGNTGRLTTPDGMIHFDPVPYKGFVIELYGQVTYMNQFDVYGKMMIIGTATGEVSIQDKKATITFNIEDSFKYGILDVEDAMKFFIGLIDSYSNHKN